MKRIFVSQSELDNGRNRGIRRLIAKLDNQQQVVSNNIPNRFSSVDTGEDSGLSDNSGSPPFTSSPVCNHYSYCKSPHKFMIKCNYPNDCRIKKFYDKWGENGNQLGMGS